MQLGRGEYVVLSLIYKNVEAAKHTKSATGYIHSKRYQPFLGCAGQREIMCGPRS